MAAEFFPGERLTARMSRESRTRVGGLAVELATDLERLAEPLIRSIPEWWKRYEAKPRFKEKHHPFRNASNVVVPLVGIMVDALVSRSFSQFTAAGDQFWTARTENEEKQAVARDMARYVNWQARHDFSMKSFLYDWLLELYNIGSSVAALNYRHEIRPMFFGGGKRPQAQRVEVRRGPVVEHVPREGVLWDTRFRIEDAPTVVRLREWSWSQMVAMAQNDPAWSKEDLEEVKGSPGLDGFGSYFDIQEFKREEDERGQLFDNVGGPHLVYEMHVDWPILSGEFDIPGKEGMRAVQLPLVLHLHRKTGRVLRVVAEPYHLPGKPFLDGFFRKRPDRGHAVGVAKKMEQLASMQTTLFNQSIDAQTRSNMVWAKTRNRKHLEQPLDGAHPILVSEMGELEALNVGNPIQPNISLLVAAQQMAERWMGPTDPLLGRETRSGGHPAPATSTLALLEQTSIMAAGTDLLLEEQLSKMGMYMAILDQQFETNEDGKLERVLGALDAQTVGEFIFPTEPIPAEYTFEMVALSKHENPDTQMRRALTIAQANQNYWAFVTQGAQVLESPQLGPLVKTVWTKAIDSMTRVYERFLAAGNQDDLEKFLVQLDEIGIDARNAFQQFSGQARALAAGAGAVQGQGPAGGSVPGAQGGVGGSQPSLGLLQ